MRIARFVLIFVAVMAVMMVIGCGKKPDHVIPGYRIAKATNVAFHYPSATPNNWTVIGHGMMIFSHNINQNVACHGVAIVSFLGDNIFPGGRPKEFYLIQGNADSSIATSGADRKIASFEEVESAEGKSVAYEIEYHHTSYGYSAIKKIHILIDGVGIDEPAVQ
jgi:hypothetical protein